MQLRPSPRTHGICPALGLVAGVARVALLQLLVQGAHQLHRVQPRLGLGGRRKGGRRLWVPLRVLWVAHGARCQPRSRRLRSCVPATGWAATQSGAAAASHAPATPPAAAGSSGATWVGAAGAHVSARVSAGHSHTTRSPPVSRPRSAGPFLPGNNTPVCSLPHLRVAVPVQSLQRLGQRLGGCGHGVGHAESTVPGEGTGSFRPKIAPATAFSTHDSPHSLFSRFRHFFATRRSGRCSRWPVVERTGGAAQPISLLLLLQSP